MQQQFSSTLLEKAVAEFSKLPGIGRKTALRLVLFMLKRKSEDVELFADTISRFVLISPILMSVRSVLIPGAMLLPSVLLRMYRMYWR